MKKTIISTLKVAAVAVILASCNNSEEAKKLQEADAAAVQSGVDAKLAGLQTEVDATCATLVDSLATEKYNAWVAEESKKPGTNKPKPKPKPKPTEPKKEEPKTVGNGKPAMDNNDSKTIGNGKPKMENTDSKTIGNGKPKM